MRITGPQTAAVGGRRSRATTANKGRPAILCGDSEDIFSRTVLEVLGNCLDLQALVTCMTPRARRKAVRSRSLACAFAARGLGCEKRIMGRSEKMIAIKK